ncbi:exopolyphosphatase / guanosine-5'-triphosphate,3'-diphosphate pyrophosphatase [Novosphingobium sp. CF614]|uniref:Ppx/GppA phosphatase family protein n=1 Tax=Novosphingobium sp. CF614 TaxID=1884364 RepID=UPI0008EE4E01|nr:Ppx/GppA phosphatase family protein [Novosphingobium sp. CF614]SFF79769.1 exopolyphosphatase / guanosine-5'-triphosphate,3'-diphosphate pyrophosphatase [Novosphingobium sp. CF614]
MAEYDPPAAKVDVPGRPGRRRKGRKGKPCPPTAGTAKAKARPPGGALAQEAGIAPRDDSDSSHATPASLGSAGQEPARQEPAGLEPQRQGSPRQSYAAIDLGTNNCRLLIARPSGENFTVIDAFSRVVRLGEGLAQSGRLSDAAMERTLAALRVCADKLMRRNVYLARSVATEACRRAENGPEFIERVRRETGIALDIISAREEARLAVLGCHILLEQGPGPAMIFDIGGGSTELVLIESTDTVPRILDWQSVPWGVVSLTETCGPEGDSREERLARYRHMHGLVSESFAAFSKRVTSARDGAGHQGLLRLLGTSGTVTTLASLHLELPQYDRRVVDGLIVPADSMRGISLRLSTMTIDERRELNCIGRERADLVVAGCAILEAILDLWPAARLGVADRGIREGILRSLIASHRSGPRHGEARGRDTRAVSESVRKAMALR